MFQNIKTMNIQENQYIGYAWDTTRTLYKKELTQ